VELYDFLRGGTSSCDEASHMALLDGEEIKYHALVITDVDCVGWLASGAGQLNPGVYTLEC
jgi:hypothetical protein